jgi:hypothetical protein
LSESSRVSRPAPLSAEPRPAGRTSRIGPSIVRAVLGAFALSIVLSVPAAVEPAPAAAASCTGWDSRTSPPLTIRVLRTASGRVEAVDFRRYVAQVMASGEWPTHLPVAALEVGAVAVKQYAWYHALAGNHRSSHRTASGACYDVRDDTSDQLYRPERASPTARQQGAIDRTWGLSLRKNGRFFLTGYRYGDPVRCAADANGWKLYERSIVDCASRLGWGRSRILKAYLSPNLTEVWNDGPSVSSPSLALVTGALFPDDAGVVKWGLRSDGKVTRYQLQRRVNAGSWRNVALGDPLARKKRVQLWGNRTHQFRVRAHNARGAGQWATGPKLVATLREPGQTALIGGDWQTATAAGATAGTVSFTASSGHRSRIRFKGRSIGWVTSMGPGMGRARVLVNGRQVALIDLSSGQQRSGQLAWTRNWPKAAERTVVVEVAGSDGRVEVDAFLLLR